MKSVVVDASTTLAWCFPDEASEYADSVLLALEERTILVPAIWSLELTNAIWVAERKKRLGKAEIQQFMGLLKTLAVVQDVRSIGDYLTDVLPLARENSLSAYDVAYLELCVRHSAPLATLDSKLERAAKRASVPIFAPTKRT